MSQTVHNQSPDLGEEGSPSSASDHSDIVSGIALETNDKIPFGRAVRIETPPAFDGIPIVELPNATGEITGDSFLGVSLRDPTIENSDKTSFVGYATGEVLSIMKRGRMTVITEDAVTAAREPVFVRFTKEAPDIELGTFRTDADGGKAVALPGAHFMTTAAAGGLVVIELSPED